MIKIEMTGIRLFATRAREHVAAFEIFDDETGDRVGRLDIAVDAVEGGLGATHVRAWDRLKAAKLVEGINHDDEPSAPT
ncbi:hypothetical protein [uncultured Rhodospira sp.]|uniref:hypothetical protein n=1 Tax=uncultured Rhodospira sp. TaxID=1936189 RepID=UPI002635AA8B|nr:hypothetical protein [uncultured Rhodospira sp.]